MRLMIEVFPAPVAPTMATLSPAEIVKFTSRRTQSPSLYAKLTLSKRTSPRTCVSSRGCGGATIVGPGALNLETRSPRAHAAPLQFAFLTRDSVGVRENA